MVFNFRSYLLNPTVPGYQISFPGLRTTINRLDVQPVVGSRIRIAFNLPPWRSQDTVRGCCIQNGASQLLESSPPARYDRDYRHAQIFAQFLCVDR